MFLFPSDQDEPSQMTQQLPDQALRGRRVLVVEDEYFLADDIVRELKKAGAQIIGPLGDVGEACNVVAGDPAIDAAVLDVNLRSQMVFPLARKLRARNVHFVFTTGYDSGAIDPEFQNVKLWDKPIDVRAMVQELLGSIGTIRQ